MNDMKNAFSIIAFLFFYVQTNGQSAHSSNRKGDVFYDKSEFKKAEEQYQKALEKDTKNNRAEYNAANSAFEMGEYARSIEKYKKAIERTENASEKAAAFHNIGNAHFKQQQFEEAAKAYRNALRYNGQDLETKKNLSLAQKQLKQQQEEQKKKQEQQEKDDQKDQQNQSENEPKDEPKQDSKMSKKEAEDMLKILSEEEKKVQKKPKNDGQHGKIQRKDW